VREIISINNKLGQFHWAPGLKMSLLAAIGFSLFVGLGVWQLQRAEDKALLYASFEAATEGHLATAPAKLGEARYRTLQITGRYVADRQILIDNMTHQGRVGYQVLTPFQMTDVDPWLMVNRGWVQAPALRSELPAVDIGVLNTTISGKMDRLPQPGLRLEQAAGAGEDWPRVMVFPTFEDLSQALGKPVFDYQLLLDPEHSDGFQRHWTPRVMGPDKHRAYAAQWFVFALVLVALFIVLNLSREVDSG
jgi:surfeit locus 1 family protein